MRVHEYVESIALRYAKNFDREADPLVIVYSWTGMFDCLPSEYVSNGIVSPFSQFAKVMVCILERKRTTDEGNVICIEEVLGDVGGDLRMLWVFGISSDIDASQGDLTVLRVAEPVSVYLQS